MEEKKATAILKYLKIAPRKTRLVASVIKNLPLAEAESELLFRPQRSAKPILKLLRSAAANAKNAGMNIEKLFVAEVRVDQGPMLKRGLPRAMGRMTPIHKKMSHVTISLKEKEGLIKRAYKAPKVKMSKSEKNFSEKGNKEIINKKETKNIRKNEKNSQSGAAPKKMFRRKAIG